MFTTDKEHHQTLNTLFSPYGVLCRWWNQHGSSTDAFLCGYGLHCLTLFVYTFVQRCSFQHGRCYKNTFLSTVWSWNKNTCCQSHQQVCKWSNIPIQHGIVHTSPTGLLGISEVLLRFHIIPLREKYKDKFELED